MKGVVDITKTDGELKDKVFLWCNEIHWNLGTENVNSKVRHYKGDKSNSECTSYVMSAKIMEE